jgi:hypothetical protein
MMRRAGVLGLAAIGTLGLACAFAGESAAQCASDTHPRVVHRTVIQREVKEPGVYEVRRLPSVYGWVKGADGEPRRVLLRPYKNGTHFQRPYVSWYRERQTIAVEPVDPDC